MQKHPHLLMPSLNNVGLQRLLRRLYQRQQTRGGKQISETFGHITVATSRCLQQTVLMAVRCVGGCSRWRTVGWPPDVE